MIIDIKHDYYCRHLLIEHCKDFEEIHKLSSALDNIANNLDKFGLVEPYEAVLSVEKYFYMSKLITFPEKTIVIDCGCNTALQQVLFNHCYKYIGIDALNNFQQVSKNAGFKHGLIEDILPKLELSKDKTLYGISNLCCSFFKGNALKEFKNKFDFFVSV